MTRTYSLVIEGDEAGYSAHVPELPNILVTGRSVDEVTSRAKEAIRIYWEELAIEVEPNAFRKEIEVELPSSAFLQPHDFRRLIALQRVARIDDEFGAFDDAGDSQSLCGR